MPGHDIILLLLALAALVFAAVHPLPPPIPIPDDPYRTCFKPDGPPPKNAANLTVKAFCVDRICQDVRFCYSKRQ